MSATDLTTPSPVPVQPVLKGRELIVAVCGGIAAYKVADVVSKLVQLGAGVSVVMTAGAQKFVAPLTFEALSGRKVRLSTHDLVESSDPQHVGLTERADLMLVAPAMNSRMWDHPIAQENFGKLASLGYRFIGPEQGWLACRNVGVGRMSEPAKIVDEITRMLTEPGALPPVVTGLEEAEAGEDDD